MKRADATRQGSVDTQSLCQRCCARCRVATDAMTSADVGRALRARSRRGAPAPHRLCKLRRAGHYCPAFGRTGEAPESPEASRATLSRARAEARAWRERSHAGRGRLLRRTASGGSPRSDSRLPRPGGNRGAGTLGAAVVMVAAAALLVASVALLGCGAAEHGAGQKFHCPMHPTYISDRPGDCPICGMRLVPIEERTAPTTVPSYVCPMHPEVTSDRPGERCSKCGMKLVPAGDGAAAGAADHTTYTCPMHPEFRTDDPDARCPECGMRLVVAGDRGPGTGDG